ncbi:MAG: M48 family metallopeptidase [Myxococcota bacterium]
MATDFFDNQDRARRNTGRLVFLFGVAVLAIVGMLYAVAVLVVGYHGPDPYTGATRWDLRWWDAVLLAEVGLATLAIVGAGSLYKTAQLRGGGRVVAESLAGRLLHGDSPDPLERQLLNVVEEMAIASGTATPPVYLLDHEAGINAFAAGFGPSDAVIGVTRGTVEQLSRSELQGVIAHEFSHVMNGDMRLNIRLMGVVHGILIIGIIGYFLLRSSMYGGAVRRRDSRDNSGVPILAIGFGLMVTGFLGTVFGNLIKASVSRQREFLADASAVQFTRDPSGIAGALKKIGGFEAGSGVQHPNAPEASHMFFGRAIASGFGSLFATHPPLEQRIRRIDPSFDGRGSEIATAAPADEMAGAAGFAGAGAAAAFDHIGQTTPEHLRYAEELMASLPPPIVDAAHEPYGARALLYALLIDRDPQTRRTQLSDLAQHADPAVAAETQRLLPDMDALDARVHLPLVDILIPALRQLSPSQYRMFADNVNRLIRADRKIDLFEWTLQRILLQHLAPGFESVPVRRVKHGSLDRLRDHGRVVLSALAHAGGRSPAAAQRAFAQGAEDAALEGLDLLDAGRSGLAQIDEALFELDALAPLEKRRLLHACATTVCADRTVTVAEAELLRAVADSLACPMPPLLPGQTIL